MERKLEGTRYAYVYDTDPISLDEILSNINGAFEWNNYYVVTLKSDDHYNNCIYFIEKQSKKIEWSTDIWCFEVAQEATAISPEEVKRALS